MIPSISILAKNIEENYHQILSQRVAQQVSQLTREITQLKSAQSATDEELRLSNILKSFQKRDTFKNDIQEVKIININYHDLLGFAATFSNRNKLWRYIEKIVEMHDRRFGE